VKATRYWIVARICAVAKNTIHLFSENGKYCIPKRKDFLKRVEKIGRGFL
jgi:hypothetical protein